MQQKIIFTAGMDSDTSSELIGEGKARKRINVRVLSSDNDESGSIEPVLGNEEVAYTLPAGTNKVIGSEEDLLRQKVYYFVYNSTGEHSILQYDLVTDTIDCVLQNPILNFDVNHLITGIDFVELDANNHLLYWTDYFNEPKKINIEKGILHSAPVPDYVNGYPTPFEAEFIFRIKQPMLLSPTAVYGNDPDVLNNRLVNKLFQFKTQFVYDDSEVSAWSPISKTVYPASADTVLMNNVITVTVDTGIEIVKRIRIAVKETNATDFALAVDLDKADLQIASNGTYPYDFFNDGNYSALPLGESIKLFDNVPKLSQAQEIVKPTRITDGNIVEGFDPVPVDLKLEVSLNTTPFGMSVQTVTVLTSGSQLTKAPDVAITGDGTGATAEVTDMFLGAIIINQPGSGYIDGLGIPLTVAGGGGTGGAATCDIVGGMVTNILITSPGSGYKTPPLVTVVSGGGVGAIILLELAVSAITITNIGTGYTTAAAVFSGGSGTGLVATANVDGGGSVTSVTVDNPGTGYTQTPIVTVAGGAPNAKVILGMEIESVDITAGGTGYTPGVHALAFSAGGGTLGAGTFTVSAAGVVTSTTITNPGINYRVSPQVDFSAGGGMGAEGISYLKGNAFTVLTPGNYAGGPTTYPVQFFNTPIQPTASLAFSTSSTLMPINALKRGGQYTYGIIYYDHGNRSGVTNINDGRFDSIQPNGSYGTTLFVPFYTQIDPSTTLIYGGDVPVVSWQIFNEAPSWATHYQFARQKNVSNDRYIQFVADETFYLDNLGAILTFGDPAITQGVFVIENIAGVLNSFKTANPGSLLVYDFVKGDRIRFIKDTSGSFLNEYWDFEVQGSSIGTSGQEVSFRFPNGVVPPTFPNLVGGAEFEIYQPSLQVPVDSKLTYEFGEGGYITYDAVNNKYIHEGTTSDITSIDQKIIDFSTVDTPLIDPDYTFNVLAGHGFVALDEVKVTTSEYSFYGTIFGVTATEIIVTRTTAIVFTPSTILAIDPTLAGVISRAASGTFSGGDTFYRVRLMPYGQPTSVQINLLIEDANYSDTYVSPGYDYGRPNRIDKLFKEISRISTIYYSETFIPETFINGLSSVPDGNFESYDASYGGIYKLYNEDQSLICYQELKISNIMVSKVIYNDLSGGNSVGASQSVLSPEAMYYAGEYGIGTHPESFAVYGKSKYSIDPKRGTVIRLSTDGLTPISETGFMHNFFTDKCKELVESGGQIRFYGVYDIKFNEYIISLGEYDGANAETLAWNERANQWSTFYSYIPENMCSLNTGIVSFDGGTLYKHNFSTDPNPLLSTNYNNFYGTPGSSEFWVYCNAGPSNVKILTAISEETNAPWEVYEILTPNGQQTNLIAGIFALTSGGSGYTPDGVYSGIALLGGSGTGATVDVTITGGIVTAFTVNNPGSEYESEDVLTLDPSTFIPSPTTNATFMFMSSFEEKENNQYASVLRDINTPIVSVPLIEGNVMRDRTFLAKFKYTPNVYNKINAINFYFISSELSNRN